MRHTQHLNFRHEANRPPATWTEPAPDRVFRQSDPLAGARAALNEMGDIVSRHCMTHPDSLTEERITAYALALLRLRECAHGAKLERLMNACDALAVTVSQLIEDRRCACRQKCEALMRFIGHAEAMIQMSPWQGDASFPRVTSRVRPSRARSA